MLIAGGQSCRLSIAINGSRLGVFSPHGSGSTVGILELPDGKVLETPGLEKYDERGRPLVRLAALSPDGNRIALSGRVVGHDHWYHVGVWDIKTGVKHSWETDTMKPNGLVYSANGTMFAICGNGQRRDQGVLAVYKVPELK